MTQQEIDARDSCTIPLDGRTRRHSTTRRSPCASGATVRTSSAAISARRSRRTCPRTSSTWSGRSSCSSRGRGRASSGVDPATGKAVLLRSGRFGPYVQLGEAEADEKPKMKSLLPGMTPENVTLEQAARLLSLPRDVGVDPESGEMVVADYGRYGPYLKRGSETRSLDQPEDVFEIGLEAALQKLLEPKPNRRRGPTALRELGADPAGNVVKLMAGRYGPYVTDGTTNASLPRGADPGAVTIAGALELLEARRNAGPSKKRATRRKTTSRKKTGAKKRPRGG